MSLASEGGECRAGAEIPKKVGLVCAIGILRLRSGFASRSRHSARDDSYFAFL
jgi:hypothetical protein